MATQQMKIDLTAKDKTGKAFRSLNARLEKTRKVAKSVAGAVLKIGAAGVALAAGFVAATKKALEFADTIAKTADKVGLSTDALQKYRYAADLAGVSNAELDKAFDKLNKGIGESISDGTGAAFDAFTQLGLQADLVSGRLRGTEPVFLAVADAISKVKVQSQRAALLADLLGRSGTKLANLMKNGSVDIKAAGKQLDDFGGILEEGMLRNSEKALDAITRLTTLMQTKLTKALASNAELIADFGTELLENLPKIIDGLKSVLKWLGLIEKKPTLVDLIDEQIKQQKVLDRWLKHQNTPNFFNKEKFAIALKKLALLKQKIEEIRGVNDAIDMSLIPLGPPKKRNRKTSTGSPGLSLAERKKADEAAALSEKVINLAKKTKAIRAEILKSAQDTAAAAKFELEYANASAAVKNRAHAALQIENRLKSEGITLSDVQREQLKASLNLTQERQESLVLMSAQDALRTKAALEFKAVQQATNELVKTGLQSMRDGIAGLIEGTQTWRQALGGVLKTIINIVSKMGETKGGGFSFDKLASGLGGLISGNNPNNFQSGFNSAGQMVDLFHTGGRIGGQNGKMPGLRSDERMIIGQTGERVLSRGQTAQGGGGGITVNQTINVSTGVQQTVRAEVMSLAPQIAAQAKAAVLDAKRRGGTFGGAFA